MEKEKRMLILNQFLTKSDKMMDDIVRLMRQLYSTNNSVIETKEIEKYRNIIIEQSKKSVSKSPTG
jgi:hypothetical protein